MRYHHLVNSSKPCARQAIENAPCQTRAVLAIALSAILWAGLVSLVILL